MEGFEEGTLIEKTANGWIVKDDISEGDITDLGFRTKHVFTNTPEGFEAMMNHLTDVLYFDMSDGFGGFVKSRNINK